MITLMELFMSYVYILSKTNLKNLFKIMFWDKILHLNVIATILDF